MGNTGGSGDKGTKNLKHWRSGDNGTKKNLQKAIPRAAADYVRQLKNET